jgi:two-component system, LytTR family, sensor kinase
MKVVKDVVNISKNSILHHFTFWIGLVLLFTFLDMREEGSFMFYFSYELINVMFYATIHYFNIFFLIPNYLEKNKIAQYFIYLFATAIVLTPIKILILYIKYDGQLDSQKYLLSHQYGYYFMSLMVAGFSVVLNIITDWNKQLREKKELETQTIQSELNFLKSQINPHFLFNTLNSLYALTLKKSPEAPEIVIKLSEMMRYMLYECNEKWVPLTKEVNYLKNYIDLERLRQSKPTLINFEILGDIENQKIAPLLFIPFIENCFKHGINQTIDDGFINIKMIVDKSELEFYVENSKIEKKPSQQTVRSGGIGLINVKRRLELIYAKEYVLDIKETPNIYKVTLKLNLV